MKSNVMTRITMTGLSSILLFSFSHSAFSQPKDITVMFGNGEQITLFNWAFVYHIIRSNEIVSKGTAPIPTKKKSQNLYLLERYDKDGPKTGIGKEKEISITGDKLASIEYLWDWKYGTLDKVIIKLTDGTQLVRTRLGPVSTTSLGSDDFLYGKGIYLEGDYKKKEELKHLNYNLNKWLKETSVIEDVIVKITFS